jgi:Alginate lyase
VRPTLARESEIIWKLIRAFAVGFGPMRKPPVIARLALGLVPLLVACSAPAPPAPPPPAGSAAPTATAQYPAEVLDLTNWYLTLPTGSPGEPDTVMQPQLATYTSEWFHVDGDGVAFTAGAGGVTTQNSTYPRSELREMDGAKKASWSNTSGTHVMELREAFVALPVAKPDVVGAQIHDTESDVIEVRLEGARLLVKNGADNSDIVMDPDYVLGTPYDLRIVAAGGHITVFYNGVQKADILRSGAEWYFKAGSYVQSNLTRGDQPDAVGTVVISALKVTHTP